MKCGVQISHAALSYQVIASAKLRLGGEMIQVRDIVVKNGVFFYWG